VAVLMHVTAPYAPEMTPKAASTYTSAGSFVERAGVVVVAIDRPDASTS